MNTKKDMPESYQVVKIHTHMLELYKAKELFYIDRSRTMTYMTPKDSIDSLIDQLNELCGNLVRGELAYKMVLEPIKSIEDFITLLSKETPIIATYSIQGVEYLYNTGPSSKIYRQFTPKDIIDIFNDEKDNLFVEVK